MNTIFGAELLTLGDAIGDAAPQPLRRFELSFSDLKDDQELQDKFLMILKDKCDFSFFKW